MTSAWLFSRILKTGYYNELELRIAAKHRDRERLMRAYFDILPPWLRDDIAAQWQEATMIKEEE